MKIAVLERFKDNSNRDASGIVESRVFRTPSDNALDRDAKKNSALNGKNLVLYGSCTPGLPGEKRQ